MAEIIDLPDAYGKCWRVVPIERMVMTMHVLQVALVVPRREECSWFQVTIFPTVLDAIGAISSLGGKFAVIGETQATWEAQVDGRDH